MRTLIAAVEAWHAAGEPTRKARLAQARAFLDLCMTDRAWIRLKELADEAPDDVRVLELTARMFLRRGWPNRAKKPLKAALAESPDDDTLKSLWEQVEHPTEKPGAVDDDSSPSDRLAAAEHLLATGSMLKGRALLERLRRDDPDDARVGDLLWVLDGDFTLEVSLSHLTGGALTDLSGVADLTDDAEHTESVGMDDLMRALEDKPSKDKAAFPSLFRSSESTDKSNTDTDEITRATSLADLGELRQSVEAARKSAGHVAGEEDTQIRRIIRRDDGVDYTDAGPAIHLKRTVPDDSGFDLQEYRRSLGVSNGDTPVRSPKSDLDDPLEEEDDDLIILTRREDDPDQESTVLEPDPTSESVERPDAVRFLAEAERQRQLAAEQDTEIQPVKSEDPTPAPAKPRPKRRARRTTNTPIWLLVLAILLGIAAFFMALVVMYQMLTG